ncbi:MAG: GNAT family N-acetyltransferase [Bacillota bacterium]|nr:GNAT family N-acetyltransferase [Bacillota bacterium]
MGLEYLKGAPEDKADIIDFANYIFSHAASKTDFPTLLPKLYGKNANSSESHYIIKSDGKIIAMLGAFDSVLHIGERQLHARGIGTVSVHPYHRNEGLMRKLMEWVVSDMRHDGVDISELGGRRQRYQYYGFERCGLRLAFEVNKDNIKHSIKSSNNICFKPLTTNYINDSYVLWTQNEVRVSRNQESFYDILCSWSSKPFAVVKDGDFAGYAVFSNNLDTIEELCLKDENDFKEIIPASVNFTGNTVKFSVQPYEQQRLNVLQKIAERTIITHDSMFQIFNFPKVLEALLLLRKKYIPLSDGKVTLQIDEDEPFTIIVTSGDVQIISSNLIPDIKLSVFDAMGIFFSPICNFYDFGTDLNNLLHSWFPLPLFFPKQDGV